MAGAIFEAAPRPPSPMLSSASLQNERQRGRAAGTLGDPPRPTSGCASRFPLDGKATFHSWTNNELVRTVQELGSKPRRGLARPPPPACRIGVSKRALAAVAAP